jgi:hypothetical protein
MQEYFLVIAVCVGLTTTFFYNNWWNLYIKCDWNTVNSSTGVITGVAAGTATITYTVTGTGGCVNANATRTVTVTPIQQELHHQHQHCVSVLLTDITHATTGATE